MLHDLDLIVGEGAELGLYLNHHKSGIICSDHVSRGTLLCDLPNTCVTDPEKATLLGSPIGDTSCSSAMIQEKIGMLKTIGEKLKYLPSHDAIILLHHSFAIPKLLYTLKDLTMLPITRAAGV